MRVGRLGVGFGRPRSTMRGGRSGHVAVRTSSTDGLATTWTQPPSHSPVKAMIALGNWSAEDRPVTLAVDWSALGLDASRVRLHAPAVDAFQSAGTGAPGATITVPGGRGLVLLVEQR